MNPRDFSFADLVKTTFAPDAEIHLNMCESAQGGKESLGYAFKELLPDANVYGWTGNTVAIPINVERGDWLILPWIISRKVEIELE